jgi:hypothetical protein
VTVIVIHAGMPKAGSSSVQLWLERNAGELRERGFTVVVGSKTASGAIELVPHERGPVNSGWIVNEAVRLPDELQRRRSAAFVAGLSAAAERYGSIVISAEAFAIPFWSLHPASLDRFQWLATRHRVRVAYYARPQHTCLEATWRQWGFRLDVAPSTYIEERVPSLAYATTRDGVARQAPSVDFQPRPFRADLLEGGDVVRDFATCFLGLEPSKPGERVNVGLPLELAILLREAPSGMFWDNPHDNTRLDAIGRALDGGAVPEGDRIALSRRILRKYAYERYAAENAELGWDDFVTLPEAAAELPGIEALDSLWAPSASPAELEILFRALRAAIGA